MTQSQESIIGLDSAILMPSKVWQASGHLTAGFADLLVECKKCHKRFKGDEVKACPECGGQLTEAKKFNLMMKTLVGPVEKEAATVYLRAETTQGIYVNFKNILNSMRLKVPFGVAQIGKAFRNEITPGNFTYRTREFEQIEMEWFCHPKQADKYFDYWKKERFNWYLDLGIKKQNLRLRDHKKSELAHYAKKAVDIEYKFPFGWSEIEGIHNRGDWDLSNHSKHSGESLEYLDPETNKTYTPYVIETSGGIERSFFTFLIDSYQEVKGGRTKTTQATKEVEVMLKLNKELAPIKVAVLPLVKNKPKLVKKAKEVYKLLKPHFKCQYDEGSSIGRRYRRQDEVGTLFCITVDFDTLEKNDVTIRDRDTMKQKRIKTKDLVEVLKGELK
jgi:glycyl-tRNA synthetase